MLVFKRFRVIPVLYDKSSPSGRIYLFFYFRKAHYSYQIFLLERVLRLSALQPQQHQEQLRMLPFGPYFMPYIFFR
jgi:hypothetical protein